MCDTAAFVTQKRVDFYEKFRYNTRYRQEVMYEYYNW